LTLDTKVVNQFVAIDFGNTLTWATMFQLVFVISQQALYNNFHLDYKSFF
jgi:hypothetical protein